MWALTCCSHTMAGWLPACCHASCFVGYELLFLWNPKLQTNPSGSCVDHVVLSQQEKSKEDTANADHSDKAGRETLRVGHSRYLRAGFSIVLVTFLALWQKHLTEPTWRRKDLFCLMVEKVWGQSWLWEWILSVVGEYQQLLRELGQNWSPATNHKSHKYISGQESFPNSAMTSPETKHSHTWVCKGHFTLKP